MHVVIYTQYRENYGTASQPYFKNKGGDTYVLTDVTVEEVAAPGKLPKIMGDLFALIEYSSDMASETVVDWELRDGEFQANPESWDVPIFIRREGDEFLAEQNEVNNDFQFREEIASKRSTWNMTLESGRRNYQPVYTMRDGRVLSEEELCKFVYGKAS